MRKTTIIGINAVILAILLIIMIYPLKPQTSLKREVTLRWLAIYKNYSLYIDDNKEFTSPIEIKTQTNSYKISLEPGTYFWKIKAGKISSPVR